MRFVRLRINLRTVVFPSEPIILIQIGKNSILQNFGKFYQTPLLEQKKTSIDGALLGKKAKHGLVPFKKPLLKRIYTVLL